MALQVWSIRLLSNLIWDQFAATIVAGGVAGGAAGALWAGRQHRLTPHSAPARLDRGFMLLGLGLLGHWLLLTQVEFDPFRAFLQHDGRSLLELAVLLAGILLMAGVTGWILAHALACSGLRLRLVYSADLLGAGAGVVAAVLLGGWIGPLQGILCLSAAALLWSAQLRSCRGTFRSKARTSLITLGILTVPVALWGRGDLHFPEGKLLHGLEPYIDRTVWGPAVRMDVLNVAQGHFHGSGGISKTAPEEELPFRLVLQDGGAPTAILGLDGDDLERSGIWRKYLQAAPFAILDHPRVLILGPGGGLEIAISAHHGAAAIECVEINAGLIRFCEREYAEFQSGLWSRPELSVHWGDARHFLSRTKNEYDLVLMCGVDSFAAGPGGMSAASENYLYTIEAAEAMLACLSDRGILAVTRMRLEPPRESLRLVATLAEALERRGSSDPAASLLILEGPPNGAGIPWAMVMAKPGGYGANEEARVRSWAAEMGHGLLFAPSVASRNLYDAYLRGTSPWRTAFVQHYPMDIRPVSDDRPFFFLTTRPQELWSRTLDLLRGPGPAREFDPRQGPMPTGVLIGVAMASLVFLLAAIVLACSWLGTRTADDAPSARSWLFFALAGSGSLLGEIGLFQLGTFLLGMPFLAVSIVLAAMLFGAGLGARRAARGHRTVAAAAGLMLLATLAWASKLEFGLAPPGLLLGAVLLAGASAWFGSLTGSFFPMGLRDFAGLQAPHRRAQAFAVSSACSVAGAAAGPVIAILWGTRALLGISACFLIGAAAFLTWRRTEGERAP